MKRTIIAGNVLGVCVIAAAATTAPRMDDFVITRSAITAGGGAASGLLDYAIYGSIAQVDAHNAMTGADYTLTGGVIQSPPDEPVDCPGDTDGDLIVDLNDLLDVIANWGGDGSGGGDSNSDGGVDLDDLLEVIANWGSLC